MRRTLYIFGVFPQILNPRPIMKKLSDKYRLGDIQLDSTNPQHCEGHLNKERQTHRLKEAGKHVCGMVPELDSGT